MCEPGGGQADGGTGGDIARIVGPRLHPFDGDHVGGTAHNAPATGQVGTTAAVKATAAAVCPEGNEDESGRSATSSCGIHSAGGLGRSASCLHRPFDTSWAAIRAPSPAAAALRPRHPPFHAITAAAPHHSLVLSADSSTTDNALATPGGIREAARRVRAPSISFKSVSNLMTCGCPKLPR